jgi:putative endonuclease
MGEKKSAYKTSLGRRGEDLAAEYLAGKGIHVIERNFRIRGGEIDIIARDGATLVFIEVKTSRSSSFGEPETWVDSRKQKQIGKVAVAYMQKMEIEDIDCRFDVIAVSFADGKPKIHHIANAFWLEEDPF